MSAAPTPKAAALHLTVQQCTGSVQLVRAEGPAGEPGNAHPKVRRSDQAAYVEPDAGVGELVQELGQARPGKVDTPLTDPDAEHVLSHLAHHRTERKALAEDLGGDSLVEVGKPTRILLQRDVGVAENVHEAGCDNAIRGVEDRRTSGRLDPVGHLHDARAADEHVSRATWATRPVHDGPAPNNQLVRQPDPHPLLPCCRRRTFLLEHTRSASHLAEYPGPRHLCEST